MLGVLNLGIDSYETYQDSDTWALHRISSRFYLTEWFGLGSNFETYYVCLGIISKHTQFVDFDHFPKIVPAALAPGASIAMGTWGRSPPKWVLEGRNPSRIP